MNIPTLREKVRDMAYSWDGGGFWIEGAVDEIMSLMSEVAEDCARATGRLRTRNGETECMCVQDVRECAKKYKAL